MIGIVAAAISSVKPGYASDGNLKMQWGRLKADPIARVGFRFEQDLPQAFGLPTQDADMVPMARPMPVSIEAIPTNLERASDAFTVLMLVRLLNN